MGCRYIDYCTWFSRLARFSLGPGEAGQSLVAGTAPLPLPPRQPREPRPPPPARLTRVTLSPDRALEPLLSPLPGEPVRAGEAGLALLALVRTGRLSPRTGVATLDTDSTGNYFFSNLTVSS